jgi:general secretion pathway protein G
MQKRILSEQRIFFPWERRGGMLRRLRVRRARPFALVMVAIALVSWIAVRERRQSGIRQTRATLLDLRDATDAYLADHEGECPASVEALVDYGTFKGAPGDAWGRPFRLTCPGRREGAPYDIVSDGPDGIPGGLDRIE